MLGQQAELTPCAQERQGPLWSRARFTQGTVASAWRPCVPCAACSLNMGSFLPWKVRKLQSSLGVFLCTVAVYLRVLIGLGRTFQLSSLARSVQRGICPTMVFSPCGAGASHMPVQ